MTHDQFCELLRRLCAREGGQAAWAKKHGLSPAFVSDVIGKRRPPSSKICAAAGVSKEIVYRRLPDRDTDKGAQDG
jgi:hypothetical protein